jgi:GTP-binding protein HflX
VIVHVVDASHPDPGAQLKTVRDVLGEIESRDTPEIVVFNKSDLVDDDQRLVLRGLEPKAVFVSARTGEGIELLLDRIAELIPQPEIELELLIPYDRGDLISKLHSVGRVVSTDYHETGTLVTALVHPHSVEGFKPFAVVHAS